MSTLSGDIPVVRSNGAAGPTPTPHLWNSWPALPAFRPLIRGCAERRAQRRALAEMARISHLLDDVGLTRAQAMREAAKPFWRS
jgi:uncharacterized protein YjiS (DUF1127 family)